MEQADKLARNEKIKLAGIATRAKHATMTCKSYVVKIDKSHLSKTKYDFLKSVFREAKWLYNYQVSLGDVFTFPDNLKAVTVLNKDREPETRELTNLSSHMKQELIARTKINVVALSRAKKAGNKVGSLKYKSQVNSVPLKQYNNTYKVKGKSIKVQGCKKPFKVKGLDQIPAEADLTTATLIHELGDYYIRITCFIPPVPKPTTGKSIGLDFGIKDNITTSDGDKYNWDFEETKQIKKASKKFNRAVKGSRNRYKKRLLLQKAHLKLSHQKKDATDKFVSKLLKENDHICIQDENIHAWKSSKMKGWGKEIQHSIMGGIISSLKKRSETHIVDRLVPTTQLCPSCGSLNKHDLDQRLYVCDCGYHEDRDIHSAKNILDIGLKIPMGHRNTMPVEKLTSTIVGTIGAVIASSFDEAGSPLL